MLDGTLICKETISSYTQVGKVLLIQNGTSIFKATHAITVLTLCKEETMLKCTNAMDIKWEPWFNQNKIQISTNNNKLLLKNSTVVLITKDGIQISKEAISSYIQVGNQLWTRNGISISAKTHATTALTFNQEEITLKCINAMDTNKVNLFNHNNNNNNKSFNHKSSFKNNTTVV